MVREGLAMLASTPALLRRHRDEIVRAWEVRARSEPARDGPSGALPLAGCVGDVVDALAGWLEAGAPAGARPARAAARCAAPARGAAELHELVTELSLLRATILRVLLERDAAAPPPTPEEVRVRRAELARLNDGLDATIVDAVVRFGRARDRRLAELSARQDVLSGADVRYRTLVRLSPDAVLVNRNGRLTYANPAAQELFGRAADDLLGRSPLDLFHPGDHATVRERIDRLLRGEQLPRADLRIVRPRGEVRHVETSAAAFRDARGTAIQVVLRDVTERRHAEDALRGWLEAVPALAFRCDRAGAVVACNRHWLEFTGQTEEQVRGSGWMTAVHPDDLAGIGRCMEEAGRRGVYECEYRLRRRDGEHRWILARASAIRGADGEVVGWMGIGADIEDHQRVEQALRESDRRKSEFLAVLSHELRNPLAPIRNAAQLLRRVPPGSAEAGAAVEVVLRQAEHLTRLVDDLLDVTRIAHDKVRLQRARVDLREVARATSADVASSFEQAHVALRLEEPPAPVWVDADATRVAQALGNLLHNAVKFTPGGGEVRVSLEAREGRAELSVRDNGIGMEPAEIERLLEPFAQADAGLARAHGGLGLGLALARGLVELHGGTLRAASEGPGRGSTFTISLPLAAAGERPRPAPARAATGAARTIVVVEDHPDAAETLAQLLELEGHRVRIARDGRSGIALARELRPDVVVCDIGLPDVTGYEVARALRADAGDEAVRPLLVALTGYTQPEDARRAREAGFDHHLPKPPPLEALEELLARPRGDQAATARDVAADSARASSARR